MSRSPAQPVFISSPKQWAAVISPVRFEMLEFLAGLGPCSIAELAFHLDRPADGLYHHVQKLVRAGLVVKKGYRRSRRSSEAIYEVAAKHIRPDFDPWSGRHAAVFKALSAAVLRMTQRQLSAAVDQRGEHWGPPPGPQEDYGASPRKRLWARSETTWLTEADLEKVNEHLLAVQAIIDQSRAQRRGQLFTLTTYVFPLVRTRHARPPAGPRGRRRRDPEAVETAR